MRIVLHSRYPSDFDRPKGGVESVTVNLARAMARLPGNEVHVVTLERGLKEAVEELDNDIRVHRLPDPGWPQIVDILCGPGRRRLIEKIRELKPDIVHSHETHGLFLDGIPFPHVFTLHGFDHANIVAGDERMKHLRSFVWGKVEAAALVRLNHIISISPYVEAMIRKLTHAIIHPIDNPLDLRFFETPRQAALVRRILCVGWVSERKNTLGSIRAFAKLIARGHEAELIIAGQEKEAAYLQQVNDLIRERKLGDRVRLIGHINHQMLLDELGKASILLLPSYQENAPMVIAEAMAMRVPVVTSNLCGMPFMVEEGTSGYLVDPNDTGEIAEALVRIIESDERYASMCARSREIAEARFHPDVVAAKHMAVYESVIADFRRESEGA
ncbi:MAG: glycosyltransferase [Gammaproteobacteria bacterium]|nr:glycosyltransferase [Gammaproteobacteria bacterium]